MTSAEPHFFIVVNRDPLGSELLLLTIVTSNISDVRVRNRTRMETVVEITPAEYREFSVASAIDCNTIFEKPLSELAEMVRRKEVRYHDDLPDEIFARVRAAVLASRAVSDELKEML
ncbi:MAG: hypothetical protein ABR526_11835 [Chthoniobacterales bacterium]